MLRRTALVACWLACPAPVPAAEPPAEVHVDVTVRYVDVLVTDGDGEPIRGLTAQDFELLEDGVRQEITDFRAAEEEPAADSAGGAREHPWLVVLFDVKHMSFGELDRPRKAVLKLLDGLLTTGTTTSVMVLREHLEVVAPFTTDHAAVRERVREILWRAPEGKVAELLAEEPQPVGSEMAVSVYPRYAELGPDASLFGVLEALGRGLRGLRGPKTVVLLSEGTPASVDDPRVAASYQRMIASLHGGNVAVVAVDAEGLRGRLGRSDRLFRSLPQIDLLGTEGKSSLRAVARETGGRSLIGSSNMGEFLQETMEARRHVYTLGYAAGAAGDGAAGYRELQVTVSRRGARVTARRGVLAPAPPGEAPPGTRRAEAQEALGSWILPGDVPIRCHAAAFPVSPRDSLVALTVELDAASLPASGSVRADVLGSLVEVASRNVHDWGLSVRPADAAAAAGPIVAMKLLRIPWGTYVSKAVVREGATGALGATELRVDVPRQTRIGPVLSHVALLDPSGCVPSVVEGFEDPLAAEILSFEGRRLAPSLTRSFPAGRRIVVAFGVLGLVREGGATRGLVAVSLLRDGRKVREHRIPWTRGDGRGAERLQPFAQPLDLAGIEPGPHVVEVRVTDERARGEVRRSVDLEVTP